MVKVAPFLKKYWIHILVVLVILVGASWLMTDDWEMYTAPSSSPDGTDYADNISIPGNVFDANKSPTNLNQYKDIYFARKRFYENARKNYNDAVAAYNKANSNSAVEDVYIGSTSASDAGTKYYRNRDDSTNYTTSDRSNTSSLSLYLPGSSSRYSSVTQSGFITNTGCPSYAIGCKAYKLAAEEKMKTAKTLLDDAYKKYKPYSRRKLSRKQKIRRFFGMKY